MRLDFGVRIGIAVLIAVIVLIAVVIVVSAKKSTEDKEPAYYSVTADCEANSELDRTSCIIKSYLLSKGGQRLFEQEEQIYPLRYECRTDNEGLCADIVMHDLNYCKESSSSYEVLYDNVKDRLVFGFKCYLPNISNDNE